VSGASSGDRIGTLLPRRDDLLKSALPERLPRAIEAFEEAAEIARHPAVDPAGRLLIERRPEAARSLSG
jgi:hypothetical protein